MTEAVTDIDDPEASEPTESDVEVEDDIKEEDGDIQEPEPTIEED